MTTVPAIVLHLGGAGLEAVRCLGRRGIRVIGVDTCVRRPARWSRYCVARRAPDPLTQPEGLLAHLADLGRVVSGAVLFPTSDEYVAFLARHCHILRQWFRVPLPEPSIVESLMDKRRLHGLAASQGLAVPRTCVPRDIGDVAAFARAARFPCLLKPALPHLSRRLFARRATRWQKVLVAYDPEELLKSYERLARISPDLVAQEVVPPVRGGAYYVACHIPAAGGTPSAFVHRKVRTYPLDFGTGTFIESVHQPRLAESAISFLSKVGYRGLAGMEFIRDSRDGQDRLIEVNARYGLGDSLASFCGVDLTFQCYADAVGMAVPADSSYRVGPRWLTVEDDLRASVASMALGRTTVARWVRSLASGELHWDILAADDPLPAIATAVGLLGAAPVWMPRAVARVRRLRKHATSDPPGRPTRASCRFQDGMVGRGAE